MSQRGVLFDAQDDQPSRYAANLIKKKAWELVGKYGFTVADREDIEQELWKDLIERQTRFDPERGAETTFIATVVNNGVASLIEHRGAAKRDYRTRVCSLDEEVGFGDETGSLRHGTVDKEAYLKATGGLSRTDLEHRDLRIDVRRAIKCLPPELRKIAQLLFEMNVSEVASYTGIPRTTIHDKCKAIGRLFRERGVDRWVK